MKNKSFSIVGGAKSASGSKNPYLQKIKVLDFLAPEVGLNYRGSSGVKTFCGVLLSLASAAVFLAGAIYIASKYFDTSQPTVLQDVFNTSDFSKIDLVAEKRFVALIFFHENVPLPIQKLNSFVTVMSYLRTQEAIQTATGLRLTTKSKESPLIPCRDLSVEVAKLLPSGDASQTQYLNTYGWCPDLNVQDYQVLGKSSDRLAKRFEVTIYPCSLGPGKCVSQDKAAELSLSFAHVEPSFNMSNYEKPIAYAWNPNDFFHINIGAVQNMNAQLMKTEVWNDGGLFSELKLVSSAYSQTDLPAITKYRNPNTVECSVFPLTEQNCPPYMVFKTICGDKVDKLTRVYTGVVETLGEIGGIRDMIFTAALAIYWMFHSKLICRELVSSIYEIPQGKSQKLQCTKSDRHFESVAVHLPRPVNTSRSVHQPGLPRDEASEPRLAESLSSLAHRIQILTAPVAPVVELDYHTAMETIEDTLDVVSLVRRIQWLETFCEFILQQSEFYDSSEGVRLQSIASYLVVKRRLDMSKICKIEENKEPNNSHKSQNQLDDNLITGSPKAEPSSEPVSRSLIREYEEYLKQVIWEHGKPTAAHSNKDQKDEHQSNHEGPSIPVPLLPNSQRRTSLYKNQKLQLVSPMHKQAVNLSTVPKTTRPKAAEGMPPAKPPV